MTKARILSKPSEWRPCPIGTHDWLPIETWSGHYKCGLCYVIGYHHLVLAIAVAGGTLPPKAPIQPYLCAKGCLGPTTIKDQPCLRCATVKPFRLIWQLTLGGRTLFDQTKRRVARAVIQRGVRGAWVVIWRGTDYKWACWAEVETFTTETIFPFELRRT